MLDLRQLRYFIAVAETENVGRAAELLHISQSPLSRQIMQLEAQLGVLLFERHKRRVRLTSEGRDLLREARELLAKAQRVEAYGRQLGSGEVGRLAIGYVEAALYGNVLSAPLRRFRRAHPGVTLSLQGLRTDAQFEQLRRCTLDLGFVYRAPPADEQLRSALVCDEALVLAVPKGDRLSRCKAIRPAQLDGKPWVAVVRDPADTVRASLLAACRRSGFTPDICYETSEPLSSLHLVSAGLGLAVVQASLASSAPEGIVFRPLPWLDLRTTVHLVWREDDRRPAIARLREAILGKRAIGTTPPQARPRG